MPWGEVKRVLYLSKVSRSGKLEHQVIKDLVQTTENSSVSWKQNIAHPARLRHFSF